MENIEQSNYQRQFLKIRQECPYCKAPNSWEIMDHNCNGLLWICIECDEERYERTDWDE